MSEDSGFEFSFVEVNGLSLRVMQCCKDRKGIPLIICNGLGQSCETIQPLFGEMPNRWLVTFDAAGVGKSDASTQLMSIQDHAKILIGLMDQLGNDQADLMGVSWGGMLAQQATISNPTRIRRLVLAITSPGGALTLTGNPFATAEIFFPTRRYCKRMNRIMGPVLYGGEAFLSPDELAEYSARNVEGQLRGYYSQIAAIFGWSSLSWLHRISQPTLVYSGLYDPLIPFWNQNFLAALIPNSELRTFNSGHWLVYSKREVLGRELTDFLS